jgi:hypothetical protein
MNPQNNGDEMQRRLDEYEVSAIYDDAGTPPRHEVGRMRTREQRRQQLERFDLWLRTFRTESPAGYVLFCCGCGLVFGAFILAVLNFLDWLGTR